MYLHRQGFALALGRTRCHLRSRLLETAASPRRLGREQHVVCTVYTLIIWQRPTITNIPIRQSILVDEAVKTRDLCLVVLLSSLGARLNTLTRMSPVQATPELYFDDERCMAVRENGSKVCRRFRVEDTTTFLHDLITTSDIQ